VLKIPVKIPKLCPQCQMATAEIIPFCSRCGYDIRHHSFNRDRGKCIYCANIGKLTKEHVFGEWLSQHYPSELKPVVQRLRRPETLELFTDKDPSLHVRFLKPRMEANYQSKVKNVCASCNNGWMSQIQTKAMPLVKQLADGNSQKLTLEESKTLSLWAVMVSINLECHAHMPHTLQYQMDALKEATMPAGWRVYAGLLPSNENANYSYTAIAHTSVRLSDDVYQVVKFSTFCIERVLFQTISTNGGNNLLHIAKYSVPSLQKPHPLSCIWSSDLNQSLEEIVRVAPSVIDDLEDI
jgi:hypothetical protein